MASSGSHVDRLLNYWTPPAGAGDPIGCVTTSFTFDSEFFEEECLSRFLQMDTDPKEDGPLYLIEREEKLAQIEGIAVIVDQAHCRGKRSLRWDLIGFRSPCLLHAKISLLVWPNHIRIIIASGNLTGSGYRYNREIFSIFDFNEKEGTDGKALSECTLFFNNILKNLKNNNPAVVRAKNVLRRTEELAKQWGKQKLPRGIDRKVLFTGQEYSHLLTQLNKELRGKRTKAGNAYIVSPFYVAPGDPNPAIKELKKLFVRNQNGSLSWYGRVEEEKDDVEKLFYGPSSLMEVAESVGFSKVNFYGIKENETDENNNIVHRPLHMKSIWLDCDDHVFYLIGSSNFTTNGLGISRRSNYEANVLYIVQKSSQRKIYNGIQGSFPESFPLGKKFKFFDKFQDEDQRDSEQSNILPMFFEDAVYTQKNGQPHLKLSFDLNEDCTETWKVVDEGNIVLYTTDKWLDDNRPRQVQREWRHTYIPSELKVVLNDGLEGRWPVVALDASSLPPPDELKELDLEILIQILATNRPLHHALRKWMRKTDQGAEVHPKEYLNPHDKVDVSGFLLRRTRRISYAFSMLKAQLQKPCYTKSALHWRLKGPIGVITFAKAILKEAHTEDEKLFLIAELCLELSEIRAASGQGCINEDVIYKEIRSVIHQLRAKSKTFRTSNKMISKYVKSAISKAVKSVPAQI